ncbi:LLM class flavin-dependent oxidoreductase [Halobacillus amylolyticus]|uniref:LLM class flavin-dependent oxidoreductase n=1 Tax=Halobacillus amylolyticus TaxID=2932259 RepID=A0ABY4HAI6_9BACI|nr:LLM class flavin-dependent oxidoreductase [Halobacillus amylolyticus]UOR11888.1 LLM class flavin-dependent oxidoreductase [Halobacillus amylolyticus]
MKISILDQSPISAGTTAGQALQESMKLAQIGEELGYTRYWIAEHHDISGLSCSAPEVMLAYIGGKTSHIRLGAGAVLLPHYRPYRIAETYNMLTTLFPERVDLGIGRAPGGSAEAAIALSNNFLEQVRKMPETFKELSHFLYNDFPSDQMYSKISASPLPAVPPELWMLGTSEKSAVLAAENGTAYAFGQFMVDKSDASILKTYSNHFKSRGRLKQPKSILAVSVVCSETTERAEELALSTQLWNIQHAKGEGSKGVPSVEEAKQYSFTSYEQDKIDDMRRRMVIGNPQEVKQKLFDLKMRYQADEIMMITITHSYEERIESYRLIANELLAKHG